MHLDEGLCVDFISEPGQLIDLCLHILFQIAQESLVPDAVFAEGARDLLSDVEFSDGRATLQLPVDNLLVRLRHDQLLLFFLLLVEPRVPFE